MNDIINSFVPLEKWDEETNQHGVYIHLAGSFVFGSIYDIEKYGKRDLNNCKKLKWNVDYEDPEIAFIPVNVNSYHHSLLVYKKSDDTFRHYDSLGGSNFNTIQANTTNNENLIQVSCPQQSGDGWGSCGTYPPVITSILMKRFKENGLVNPADWEISKEQFLAERDQIMDLI